MATTAERSQRVRSLLACLVLLAGTLASLSARAEQSAPAAPATAAATGVGRVVIAAGQVIAERADGVSRPLREGDPIYEGDVLRTDGGSRTQVTFMDGARLAVRPASRIVIESYRYGDAGRPEQVAFRLERGGFRTATGRIGRANRSAYRFSTPQAVIGIRGTDWGAQLVEGDDEDGELQVGVNDGGITLTNEGGSVDLGDGADFAFAVVDDPTSPPLGQTAPPAGLIATLADDLPAPPSDDDSGDGANGGSATDEDADEEAAEETSDEASDEASEETSAEEDSSADSTASGDDTNGETGGGDANDSSSGAMATSDDGAGMVELGGTADEPDDVVFEYGNRCF